MRKATFALAALFICSLVFAQNTIKPTGSTTFCEGGSVTLEAKGGNNNSTYQWSKDGNPINNETSSSYVAITSGKYDVTIDGNPTDSPIDVVVNPKPIVSFTFSPNGECSNIPVNFTNTSTGKGLTYSWDFGDPNSNNNSSTAINPSHQFVGTTGNGNQNFTVKLTATSSDGCPSITQQVVNTKQLPGTQLTGTGEAMYYGKPYFIQCVTNASAFDFTNISSTKGTNTSYTIVWGDNTPNFDAGSSFTTTSHTYAVGTYTLQFIVRNNNCVETGTYYVFVGSNPKGSISSPGSTIGCTGESFSFPFAGISDNPPGTEYLIYVNDGTDTIRYTQANVPAVFTHVFNKSSCGVGTNNTFTVSYLFTNPCGETPGTIGGIRISKKAVAAFSISPSSPVCQNTVVTFTNTGDAGSTVPSTGNSSCIPGKSVWQITPAIGWTISSGSLGSDNSSSTIASTWTSGTTMLGIKFTSPGTYTIKLKTGTSQCGIDETEQTICVNPTPLASFTLSTTQGCAPFNVSVTNNSNAPNCGNNSYLWSVTYSNPSGCTQSSPGYSLINGTTLTSTNPEFNFTSPGVYTITLTTKAPGNCTSTPVNQTITVKTKPLAILSVSGSVCQNGSISPTATVSNCYASSSATYLWSFDGGSPSSSTSVVPGSISYGNTGPFTVKLDVTNECGTTSTSQNISVNPLPTLTIPSSQTFCSGQTTGGFNFNSPTGTITWTRSNVNIGGSLPLSGSGSIPSFTATNTTSSPVSCTFTVTAISSNNCKVSQTFTVTVNPTPTAPTVSPINYCQNTTATALTAIGTNLNWYSTLTSNDANTIAPTPNTGTPGTFNYYVSQTNLYACESPRAALTVTINATPNITASGINPSSCSSSTGKITISGVTSGVAYTISYTKNGSSPIVLSPQTASLNTLTISGLTAGIYDNIKVTISSCTSNMEGPITLVDPTPPSTPIAGSNGPICSGNTLSLTASSIAGATYQWTGPNNYSSISQNPNILSATTAASGTYSVIVKVANCSSQAGTVDVVVNPTPNISSIGSNTPLCEDATLNLSSTVSATSAATYSWIGPNGFTSNQTNPSVPNITTADAGSYKLTVTDGSCSSSKNTNVAINPVPSIIATSANPTSCGSSTGSITISGLTVPGTYVVKYTKNGNIISQNLTSNGGPVVINNLSAGTYSNITAALSSTGCTSNIEGPFTLSDPTPPSAPIATSSAPVCSGTTLNLYANVITGATYQWSGPNNFSSTSQNPIINSVSLLASGTYQVTAKVSGCTSPAGSVDVVINPTPDISTISPITICEGSDINLNATVNAPSGTTYNWAGPNSFSSDQLTAAISNATTQASGIYTLTATSGTCSSSKSTTATVNVVPVITATWTDPTACGSQTGTIKINGALSGTYNVTYYKNGSSVTKSLPASSGEITISGLTAGMYSNITVTPANTTCASSPVGPFDLKDPNPPAQPIISSNNSPICAGSTLTIVASGAPAGATYTWTTPSGTTYSGQTYTLPNAQTAANGSYSVKAILNACSSVAATTTVTINAIPVQPTASSNSPVCQGSALNFNAGSTTAGVTYSWSGPDNFSSTDQNPSITNVPISASGTYTVSAISSQGCTSSQKAVAVIVNPIPVFNVDVVQPTSCSIPNGVITISALTSNSAYTVQYTKDGVTMPILLRTPVNGIITLSNLTAGIYSNITVSINGCSYVQAGPYILNNPSPPASPIIASNNSPLCSGGTLILTASGAPAGGTYSWSTPSGTVFSGATLSIPNIPTSASGVYSVKSILNGCNSSPATVDVTINPVPVQPTILSNSPICDGNTLNLSASSSAGSTYSWTGPNGFTSSTKDVSIDNASFTEAGSYTVVATLGSCTSSKSTTVVVNLVPKITSYNSTDPANCSTTNGTIILRGLTANTSYSVQYTKNGGAPTSLTLVSSATGIVTIPNLSAGLYENVTVALNGCPSLPVGPFDLIQPDAPSTPVAQSNSPICVGGTINLSATTTSTGNVSYQWTGPNGFTSNLQNLSITKVTAQASGTYYVTVKVNGCSSSAGFTKVVVNPEPSAPTAYPIYYCINATPVALAAYPDLSNTLNWYSSLTDINPLGQAPVPSTSSVGTTNYYVSQTTSLGCEGPRTAVAVIVNAYPVITASSYTDPPRCSTTNGTISLSGLIPSSDYTVNYYKDGKPVLANFTSNSSGVVIISPLSAGTYSQISVSYHGCGSNIVGPFTLVESVVPPSVPKASVNPKICAGDDITLSAQSSTQGVSYQWTGPNGFVSNIQNPVITNSTSNASGKYYVLTQLNDCVSEKDSVMVQVNEVPSIPSIISPSRYCQQDKSQTLQATSTPGNTVLWYTASQNGIGTITAPLPSTSIAGTFSFYVTQVTPQGCESSRGSATITVYAKPAASIQVNGSQCEKDNLTFTSSVQSPDALSTLTWNLSNGFTATGSSLIYQFNKPGTYTSQLVASTIHGCSDTAVKTVQILPAPMLTTSQDLNLCLGNSAQLSVSGALSYQWTPVNGLSCVSCANPVALPTTTTNYVVEGTDVNGCRSFDTVIVNVIQPFKVTVSSGDSICVGSSVTLLASGAPAYVWTPSQGLNQTNLANPIATPKVTTEYIVVGYDQYKCFTDTAHVIIAVGKPPTIDLGPDTLLSTGTLYPLKSVITGGPIRTWIWNPTTNLSCTNCALPIATIKKDIAYSVKVTNAYGCTATDTILIKVTCDPSQVFIPNAFTPDGDGINDVLMVRSKGMSTVKFFRIFNRWGELVFEKENFQPNDPAFGWDGKIRGKVGPPDVFVYTAEVICDNGGVFTYKGNVSIIK